MATVQELLSKARGGAAPSHQYERREWDGAKNRYRYHYHTGGGKYKQVHEMEDHELAAHQGHLSHIHDHHTAEKHKAAERLRKISENTRTGRQLRMNHGYHDSQARGVETQLDEATDELHDRGIGKNGPPAKLHKHHVDTAAAEHGGEGSALHKLAATGKVQDAEHKRELMKETAKAMRYHRGRNEHQHERVRTLHNAIYRTPFDHRADPEGGDGKD